LPKLFDEDKMGILDIRAKLSDGKQVNIEIQVIPSGFMPERTLFYWAKMYTTQVKKGDSFKKLKECITINIVDYEFLPVNKMHTQFHLTEDETGLRLTEMIEIHFCELKKLRSGMDISDMDDPSLDWMRFIGARTKGEMEMPAQKNEAIKDAFDYLQVISKDEEKRLAYEARQMWLMDQRTREEIAREEGEKEGEKNAKIEIAREMMREGDSLEKISHITKLPLTTIQELAQSIQ
jgi:predicted transposase/invertase (TIGR01784 family)